MDGIYYNPGCTIDGRMLRGEGTKKMVNFAIKYIKSKGAKEIQLSDNSDIPCNGKMVSLGAMYFLIGCSGVVCYKFLHILYFINLIIYKLHGKIFKGVQTTQNTLVNLGKHGMKNTSGSNRWSGIANYMNRRKYYKNS
jgi:hypothetical protein